MAFCGKCGSSVAEGVAFCSQCGAPVGDAVPPPQASAPNWSATPPPPQPAQAWSASPPPPQPAQNWSTAPPPPPQAPGAGWVPAAGAPLASASGLQENVAACLSYALGWLTGIVFLLIDKRPFVRFHAAQSIVVFGGLNILRLALQFGLMGGRYSGVFSFAVLLSVLISLATVVAWVALMAFAYQGKRYEVPVASGIAKSIAGNSTV